MGLKVHHDGFELADSLAWRSAVAYVRQRLVSACWPDRKKDWRLPNTISLVGLYRGNSNTKCASSSTA